MDRSLFSATAWATVAQELEISLRLAAFNRVFFCQSLTIAGRQGRDVGLDLTTHTCQVSSFGFDKGCLDSEAYLGHVGIKTDSILNFVGH